MPKMVISESGQNSDTFSIDYDALAGDVLTITIPTGFYGDIQFDSKAGDYGTASKSYNGNVITVTFSQASKVGDYQVKLTPKDNGTTAGQTFMAGLSATSKVGNPNYMQEGDYVLGVSATHGGTAYQADTTFNMTMGSVTAPTWLMPGYPLGNALGKYTQNVEYTFTSMSLFGSWSSPPTVSWINGGYNGYVCLSKSSSASIAVPGGFKLNTTKSTAGYTQPGGAGTPIVWNNPGTDTGVSCLSGDSSIVGSFTSAPGEYTATGTSTVTGYFSYDTTPTTFTAQKNWAVTVTSPQTPSVYVSNTSGAQALIGTTTNLANHPTEVSYEHIVSINKNVNSEENENVVATIPSIDGSELLMAHVKVTSFVGETVSIVATRKDGTTYTMNRPVSATGKSEGDQVSYEAAVPLSTTSSPFVSIKVTASRCAAVANYIQIHAYYRAKGRL